MALSVGWVHLVAFERARRGIEHTLPDCFGWGVDACGGQRVLHMRPKKSVDFWEGDVDLSNLNVKNFDGALSAALYEFAASDGPVGGEPPKQNPLSKSMRTVLRHSGGKLQSIATGRLNLSRA